MYPYLEFELVEIDDINIVLENSPRMAYAEFRIGTYDPAILDSPNVTMDRKGAARIYFPLACLETIQ